MGEVLARPPAGPLRCASSSSIAVYTLAIDPSFSRIDVEVLLAAGVDRVAMSPFGAEWLDDGWATFVRELDARAADGRPLGVVEPDGAGTGLLLTCQPPAP